METVVYICFFAFGIIFIAFIFIKSFIDSKKERALMTEIFLKYGKKAEAKVLSSKENETYGRNGNIGKYNYCIQFQYNSTKSGMITCSYALPTNNPNSRKYADSIPIIYIPAYLDYYMELIDRKEFFSLIGHDLDLGNDRWLVIFAEDIGLFTDLTEL